MKAMRPVIASNGVPYLQMRSVESHSKSGRKKEEKYGVFREYNARLDKQKDPAQFFKSKSQLNNLVGTGRSPLREIQGYFFRTMEIHAFFQLVIEGVFFLRNCL